MDYRRSLGSDAMRILIAPSRVASKASVGGVWRGLAPGELPATGLAGVPTRAGDETGMATGKDLEAQREHINAADLLRL